MPRRRYNALGRQHPKSSASLLPPKPFLRLPSEIHREILKYLDIPSTICLSFVNRHLYELIAPICNGQQLPEDIKAAVRRQIHGYKSCSRCMRDRPVAAFPHLIDSTPKVSMQPSGIKGWFEVVRSAVANRKRLGGQETLMKRYGLVYPTTNPQYPLPTPGPWADEPLSRRHNLHPGGAKHIRRRLPKVGWVMIHRKSESNLLFEYRGFCGWTCQGPAPVHYQWIFQCECLRCSASASEAQDICCWCDPEDSRFPLLNLSHHELGVLKWRRSRDAPHGEDEEQEDPARILFKTKVFPYGSETFWVGRRAYTCTRHQTMEWEEWNLPSWYFTWVGVDGEYYTPGPKVRKGERHERWDDVFMWGFNKCWRQRAPHRFDRDYCVLIS